MTETTYPIYIPTYDRFRWETNQGHTIKILRRDGVRFRAVVQPQQVDDYRELVYGDEPPGDPVGEIIVLPEGDWNLYKTRCWIMEHSIEQGHARHWQIDDNVRDFRRLVKGRRLPANADIALRVCETISDRYENVAISGLNYQMFVTDETVQPFYLNTHVYSCTLVNNKIPHRWRLLYNDDTDMCLQVLSDGWCTIEVNAFVADKLRTMMIGGGNTDDLYQADGRLRMARALERMWPGTVRVDRRYQRPQHVIDWRKFKSNQLIPTAEWEAERRGVAKVDEMGMKLTNWGDQPQASSLRRIRDDWNATH